MSHGGSSWGNTCLVDPSGCRKRKPKREPPLLVYFQKPNACWSLHESGFHKWQVVSRVIDQSKAMRSCTRRLRPKWLLPFSFGLAHNACCLPKSRISIRLGFQLGAGYTTPVIPTWALPMTTLSVDRAIPWYHRKWLSNLTSTMARHAAWLAGVDAKKCLQQFKQALVLSSINPQLQPPRRFFKCLGPVSYRIPLAHTETSKFPCSATPSKSPPHVSRDTHEVLCRTGPSKCSPRTTSGLAILQEGGGRAAWRLAKAHGDLFARQKWSAVGVCHGMSKSSELQGHNHQNRVWDPPTQPPSHPAT